MADCSNTAASGEVSVRHVEGAFTLPLAVVFFFACSGLGWFYETVDNVFRFGGIYLREMWMFPWCPIYGVGGLLLVFALNPLVKRLRCDNVPLPIEILFVFIGSFFLTLVVELAGSYLCELLTGSVPWDYSGVWLNFDGRVAPEYTFKFALMGVLAIYWLKPSLLKWAHGRESTVVVLAVVLCSFAAFDMIMETVGLWDGVKDSLIVFGINHW